MWYSTDDIDGRDDDIDDGDDDDSDDDEDKCDNDYDYDDLVVVVVLVVVFMVIIIIAGMFKGSRVQGLVRLCLFDVYQRGKVVGWCSGPIFEYHDFFFLIWNQELSRGLIFRHWWHWGPY